MHPGSRQPGTRFWFCSPVLFFFLSSLFILPFATSTAWRFVSTPPQFADVVLRPLPVRLEGPARFLLEATTLSPSPARPRFLFGRPLNHLLGQVAS